MSRILAAMMLMVLMLMTPGLALFYGGMVRKKNVLGTIMQSFVAIAVVSIQWILIGYSLSFPSTARMRIQHKDARGLSQIYGPNEARS